MGVSLKGLPGCPALAFFTGVSLGAEEQGFQEARGGRYRAQFPQSFVGYPAPLPLHQSLGLRWRCGPLS